MLLHEAAENRCGPQDQQSSRSQYEKTCQSHSEAKASGESARDSDGQRFITFFY